MALQLKDVAEELSGVKWTDVKCMALNLNQMSWDTNYGLLTHPLLSSYQIHYLADSLHNYHIQSQEQCKNSVWE